jgi:hypothetical protein
MKSDRVRFLLKFLSPEKRANWASVRTLNLRLSNVLKKMWKMLHVHLITALRIQHKQSTDLTDVRLQNTILFLYDRQISLILYRISSQFGILANKICVKKCHLLQSCYSWMFIRIPQDHIYLHVFLFKKLKPVILHRCYILTTTSTEVDIYKLVISTIEFERLFWKELTLLQKDVGINIITVRKARELT